MRTPIFLLPALAAGLLLALPAGLPAQQPGEARDALLQRLFGEEGLDLAWDQVEVLARWKEEEVAFLFLGNVLVRTRAFTLRADAVVALRESSEDASGAYRLLARGNILLTSGEQSIRAETFLYENARRLGVLTAARLRLDQETLRSLRAASLDEAISARDLGHGSALQGEPLTPAREKERLVLAARELRVEDFQAFEGRGIEVTTCDFSRPHWALTARRGTATRAEGAERRARGGAPLRFHLSGVRLRLGGAPPLPLPDLLWDTRWAQALPLRRVSYSRSSKFGDRIDTIWHAGLLLPKGLSSRLDLTPRLDFLSKRGLGYGADIEIGNDPRGWPVEPGGYELYGRGLFYGIDDRGEDRNGLPPSTGERNRARLHQRLRLPTGTWIDAEYAVERDRGFLLEYYEGELRGEKTPENIIFVRQPIGDDLAATLLARKRLVPYRSVVERLPEASLHLIERPLWLRGPEIDGVARGSILRELPDNALGVASSGRLARADAVTILAWPLARRGWPVLRPFFESRITAWEEDAAGDSRERLALATGGRAGWRVWRNFAVDVERLGVHGLRHVVDLAASYRLLFENNVDPSELVGFDEIEEVRRLERLRLGARNILLTRTSPHRPTGDDGEAPAPRGASRRKLLESRLEIDYFPRPKRDHDGDVWSLLDGEMLLYPRSGLALFVDGELDTARQGRIEQLNSGISVGVADGSSLSLSRRFSRRLHHSLGAALHWIPSRRYEFAAFHEYDIRGGEPLNQHYSVVRNFHRWLVMFSLEIDEGERNNTTFKVWIGPRQVWGGIRGALRRG